MATRVWTSAQILAPIDKVWEKVRPLNFAYLSAVTSCELEGKATAGEVGSVRKITYADKTVQRIKLTQLSDAEHSLTWELIESTPAVTVMSAVYSARLRRVTENNSTFIEFCADFSKDADTNVTQDCKFKQQEHIEALRKACVRKPKNWMPLESDPELMNNYMYKLGVDETKFAFHEVLGTDDDLLAMCPQPVYAVLMLFPYTDPQEEWARKEEALIEQKGQKESKNVWYMKQTVGNACGTIGLIHVAMNNVAKLGLDPKKFFGKFHKETQKMTPDQRAEALEASDDIEAAHEATASEGGSAVEEKTNENLHFIAFTMVDGDLYELDGCKSRPINHGKTSEKTLLKDSARIIKEFMKRDPKDIRFNIVALGDMTGDDE